MAQNLEFVPDIDVKYTLQKWAEVASEITSEWILDVDTQYYIDRNELLKRIRQLRIDTISIISREQFSSVVELKQRDQGSLEECHDNLARQDRIIRELMDSQKNQHQIAASLQKEINVLRVKHDEQARKIKHYEAEIENQNNVVKQLQETLSSCEQNIKSYKRRVSISDISNNNEDPIFHTGWGDLKEHLKRKCIDYLGFKDRMSMRCTARAERKIIDKERLVVDEVHLFADEALISVQLNDQRSDYQIVPMNGFLSHEERIYNVESLISLLVYILNTCNIRRLSIEELPPIECRTLDEIDELIPTQSVHVKHFQTDKFGGGTKFFFDKFWNRLESISIDDPNFLVHELNEYQSVVSAKSVQLVFQDSKDHKRCAQFVDLIETFVMRDAPDTKLRIQCPDDQLFENLVVACELDITKWGGPFEFEVRIQNTVNLIAAKYSSNGILECSVTPSVP